MSALAQPRQPEVKGDIVNNNNLTPEEEHAEV